MSSEIYIGIAISILSLLFDGVGKYLIYYFALDLLFYNKKIDIIIHHVIVMCMFSIHYFLHFNDEDYNKMFRIIILVEISNVFLLLGQLIDKKYKIPKKIINLLFIITFFYYRIYYYGIHCIPDNAIIMTTMGKYTTNLFYVKLIFMLFYSLNLYWGIIIISKIVQKIIEPYFVIYMHK